MHLPPQSGFLSANAFLVFIISQPIDEVKHPIIEFFQLLVGAVGNNEHLTVDNTLPKVFVIDYYGGILVLAANYPFWFNFLPCGLPKLKV